MNELTSSQRSWLFKQAHHLHPVVIIGQAGLSEGILNAISEALEHHELIKIKFNEYKEEKKDILPSIAKAVRADVVRLVGHVAVLYRQNPNPEKRKYKLPR